jgi:GNAT superfamily N-acetyltransferase
MEDWQDAAMTVDLSKPAALPQKAVERLAAPDAPTITIAETDLLSAAGPGVRYWDYGITHDDRIGYFLISVDDDRPGDMVARCIFDVDDRAPGAWFGKRVDVHPAHRGVGHGRRVLATCLNEMARLTPGGSFSGRAAFTNRAANRLGKWTGQEAISVRGTRGVFYYARLGEAIGPAGLRWAR